MGWGDELKPVEVIPLGQTRAIWLGRGHVSLDNETGTATSATLDLHETGLRQHTLRSGTTYFRPKVAEWVSALVCELSVRLTPHGGDFYEEFDMELGFDSHGAPFAREVSRRQFPSYAHKA